MRRGTILSIDDKYAYIFTSDCRMEKVDWQPDMTVGEEIQMNNVDSEEKILIRPSRRNHILRWATAAACLLVLMAAGLFFGQRFFASPVYATVSVDVNPSLELSLDRSLKVIAVQAMNLDAEKLLSGHDLIGLDWREAVIEWTRILKESSTIKVQNMLISAVMPDDAEQLRTQLTNMEQEVSKGDFVGIAVRILYSYDQAVLKEAEKNGLSIGRQMLLNQARIQNQSWDESTIEEAPLGELIQNLLKNREQNQTRVTERAVQSDSGLTDETAPGDSAATIRETSRETSGSMNGSGTESEETIRETSRETDQEKKSNTGGMGAVSQQVNQQFSSSAQASASGSQQTGS